MEELKIDNIKQRVKDGKIRWTNHIIVRLFQRNISQEDIENALVKGEINRNMKMIIHIQVA